MKIKSGFIIKEVAGDYCIVPADDRFLDFGAMITANETGAFLFEVMQSDFTPASAAESMCKEYDIDYDTALEDVNDFISLLNEKGLLE